jgi:hypothetical protein
MECRAYSKKLPPTVSVYSKYEASWYSPEGTANALKTSVRTDCVSD